MSNDKQTLIDWLINQQFTIIPTIYVKQAKEIEKARIIETYIAAKMERNVVKKHFAYLILVLQLVQTFLPILELHFQSYINSFFLNCS